MWRPNNEYMPQSQGKELMLITASGPGHSAMRALAWHLPGGA